MSSTEAAPTLPLVQDQSPERMGEGYLASGWRRFRRNRTALVCLAVLTLIFGTAFFSPWLNAHVVGYEPNKVRLIDRFKPPSSEHWLGTDDFGRDVLARLLSAGRVSLAIGFMVAAISLGIGVSLGLMAAFYGRYIDDGINALIQIFNNIPTLFVLIMLSALFRPSVIMLALLFGLLGWTAEARLVRGRVLSERRRDYVDAALVTGATDLRVMYRHILPNVMSVVLVLVGFDIAGAILGEAGLSAIGFGVQIPTASWGNMLSKSLEVFDKAWWMVAAPGVMITITVFCLYVVSDAIRDALDPRLTS